MMRNLCFNPGCVELVASADSATADNPPKPWAPMHRGASTSRGVEGIIMEVPRLGPWGSFP